MKAEEKEQEEWDEERRRALRNIIIQRRGRRKAKEIEEQQAKEAKQKEEATKLVWCAEITRLGYAGWREKEVEKKAKEEWGGEEEWVKEKERRMKVKAKEQEKEKETDKQEVFAGLVQWKAEENIIKEAELSASKKQKMT